MSVTTLREYQMQERQLRSTLIMIKQFSENYVKERDEKQVSVRLGMLDDALAKFYVVRRKIDVLTDVPGVARTAEEKALDEEHTKVVWEFENLYCEVKSMLLHLRPEPSTAGVAPVTLPSVAVQGAVCRVKLPEIKLPSFGGKLSEWMTFRDTFRSLIHCNQNLSAIDKFTYLRTSLEGEALQEIGSVELTAVNYDVAWGLLEKRYENKKLILKTHLDAIFAIEPVRKENFEALNHLLSTVDKNLQMINKLGVDTSAWSIILAHTVSSKLDSTTLRHWEAHYGSREFVQYEALVEFLRDHCAVLQAIAPAEKSPHVEHLSKYVANYAVADGPSSCYFCEGPKHNLFHCPVMNEMEYTDRVAVARQKRLCFNCLSAGHTAGICTRGLCSLCRSKHHTLLHEYFLTVPRVTTFDPPADSNNMQPNTKNQPITQPPSNTPQDHRQSPTHPTQNGTQASSPPTTENTTTCNHLSISAPNISAREILLPTAVVRLCDSYGHMSFARALLDSV